MSADGFLTPGAPHAELERRYRRLLRLYPREFRARRTDEMIGVLMASAAAGQNRPARGDVSDIVRGSLRERLRGPRGGWSFALSAFALVAPLFLALTDILQVAFPYSESQAAVQSRISAAAAHGVPAAAIPPSAHLPQDVGGPQLLSQPAFLILVAGHLIVAAAVLAGLRRTALAALVIAAAADYTQWTAFHVFHPGAGTIMFLTIAVFLLEAIALAAADPRAARSREGWQHVFPALALAVAAQLLALSFDASRIGDVTFLNVRNGGERHVTSGHKIMTDVTMVHVISGEAIMVIGCVLALLAVLLPLLLGLGWRASLLLAAACYPLVILAAAAPGPSFGMLPETLGMGRMPPAAAHTIIVTILYLPPLLVLCRAVAQAVHTSRTRSRGELAAQP
ncbi:MAG: hypothetical protein QOH87_164 [Trebonia sp.]|nr:hypothetical protein [Trebonia sp.]